MMPKLLLSKIFFVSSMLFSGLASADVYKYISHDGRVFFSDSPKHSGYKRIIKSKIKLRKPASRAFRVLNKNKKKFESLIKKIAAKHQIDPKLLHAIIRAESAYNPNAVSKVGAVGLMQLMPATAKRYGVKNRRNPAQNISGGTRYLKDLLKMFNSNLKLAVAAYNAGEHAVIKYRNSIPPYRETRNYVKKVLRFYQQTS